MDNIEEVTPSGSDDVTSSQDNATADTQPAETTVSEDDGNVVEAAATNAWENDPRFKGKTADDIYKYAQEAEKLSGQLSQKAELANLFEARGFTPQQIKAQLEQMDYQQQQDRYAQNPLAPLVDEVQSLRAWKESQENEKALSQTKSEIDSFVKDNPGYEAHKSKIEKLALTEGIGFTTRFNPMTGRNETVDVPLDEIARDYFGEARAQGQQDAYNKIDTKIRTQATGTKGAPKRGFTEEDYANMSAAELKALIPMGPKSVA